MTGARWPAGPDLLVEALVPGGARFEELLAVEHSVFVIQVVLHFPERQTDSTHHTRADTRGALGRPVLQGERSAARRTWPGGVWGPSCSLQHSFPSGQRDGRKGPGGRVPVAAAPGSPEMRMQ